MRVAAAILALALTTATTQAQVAISPKVGVSLSDMNKATADVDAKGRLGFQAGVDVRLGIGFYLQPGIHYQQTGIEQTTLLGTFDLDVRSLHIPLLAGVKLGTGVAGLRLSAGPGLTIVQSVRENDGGVTKEQLTERRLGGMAGIGLDLLGMSVDLSAELGMTKFFESGFDGKLRTFRLSAGLPF